MGTKGILGEGPEMLKIYVSFTCELFKKKATSLNYQLIKAMKTAFRAVHGGTLL